MLTYQDRVHCLLQYSLFGISPGDWTLPIPNKQKSGMNYHFQFNGSHAPFDVLTFSKLHLCSPDTLTLNTTILFF